MVEGLLLLKEIVVPELSNFVMALEGGLGLSDGGVALAETSQTVTASQHGSGLGFHPKAVSVIENKIIITFKNYLVIRLFLSSRKYHFRALFYSFAHQT